MNISQASTGHKIGAFQLALLVFTILLLCGLVADTAMVLPKEVSNLIHMLDTFGCALFFADFCFRFYKAESKLAFMKWGWIDLLACIPNLEIMRWGRMIRILRIIRLLRGIRSVQKVFIVFFQNKRQGGAVSLAFTAVLLVAFSSMSILICESQSEGNIKTAEDAVWWSITTITTVGYGDKYPVTSEGRAVGMVLMIGGIAMFSGLSGLAASFFLGTKDARSESMNEILARLDQVQAALNRLATEKSAPQGLQATGPAEGPTIADG